MKLALLALALGACAAVAAAADNPFDLFLFVRFYQPGFCLTETCKTEPYSRFTIHGLWPEYANGSWPEYCNEHEDNEPAPAVLEPTMLCRWPLPNDTASWLWEHEWAKHGTCSEGVVGDREEFDETVLNLDYTLDLDSALADAGIFVGEEDSVVPLTDIEAAVESAYDVKPQLRCVSDGVTPSTISPANRTLLPALYEVWVCLDLELAPINCPEPVGAPNCQDNVILKGGKTGQPSECVGTPEAEAW